ncbi:MAG: DUF86 domain-containing protein [Alphaproteobacteria bacterium CG11_big_fil_rev_8_21_14_0_20_44_7]|nr:MAG: DUF86 domain-containing protein [Alphaproteobacteria bacterium CG11_big_fil_rev_8_21_14_0_20_44_7]
MTKDPKLYLIHIKESVNAILRVLQTMSESVGRLPDDIKANYPKINWQDIAGFRNVLVHDYLGDYDEHIIWNVIKEKLPELREVVVEELDAKR